MKNHTTRLINKMILKGKKAKSQNLYIKVLHILQFNRDLIAANQTLVNQKQTASLGREAAPKKR